MRNARSMTHLFALIMAVALLAALCLSAQADVIKPIEITQTQPPEISSIRASRTSAQVGNSVTWTPVMESTGAGGLKFYYEVWNEDTLAASSGYTGATSYTYTFSASGQYHVRVRAKDASGNYSSRYASAVLTVYTTNTPTLSSVSITASKPLVGYGITWAPVTTGVTPDEYLIKLYRDGIEYESFWHSGNGGSLFYTDEPGIYHIKARAYANRNSDNELFSNWATSNAINVTADGGAPVIHSVSCTETTMDYIFRINLSKYGMGGLSYSFTVYRDGELYESFGYAPLAGNKNFYYYGLEQGAGLWRVDVKVKDSSGAVSNTASVEFDGFSQDLLKLASVDCVVPNEPTLGSVITWTARVDDNDSGAGQPYTYKYDIYKNGSPFASSGWVDDETYQYSAEELGKYHAKVKVKDYLGNESDELTSRIINIVRSYASPIINTITANATSTTVGKAIVWTLNVTESDNNQYDFDVYCDDSWIDSGTFSSSKTASYTPEVQGTYFLRVSYRDIHGDFHDDVGQSVNVVVSKSAGVPVLSSVVTDKTTAVVGDYVVWTPNVKSYGAGALSNIYTIYRNGTVYDTVEDPYTGSTANSFEYRFETIGTWYVAVQVKDEEGALSNSVASGSTVVTANADEMKIDYIWTYCTEPVIGGTIEWGVSLKPIGSGSPYQYQYTLYLGDTEIDKTEWLDSSSITMTPSATGIYHVSIQVKDCAGKVSAALSGDMIPILASTYMQPMIDSVTVNKETAKVGDSITWTANIMSAREGRLRYDWVVYCNGDAVYYNSEWHEDFDFDSNSITVKAESAGVWYALLSIGDEDLGFSSYDSDYTLMTTRSPYTVVSMPSPSIATITASATTLEANKKITWTTVLGEVGAGAPHSYYYIVCKDGDPVRYSGWIKDLTVYNFTPTTPGEYTIKVQVKDGKGITGKTVSSAVVTVTPAKPPVISSVTKSVATAIVGDEVTWTPTIEDNGAGSLKYYYIVHKDGKPIRYTGWINASAYRYTLTTAGTFSVAVRVKDVNDVTSVSVSSSDTVVTPVASPAVSSVAVNINTADIGDKLIWIPNVSSEGAGELEYYYTIYKDGAPIRYTGYITQSVYHYIVTSAGIYSVKVKVRDAIGVISATVSSPETVVATIAPPAISSVSASISTADIGDDVIWIPNVSSEGAGDLEYYYIVYKDGKPIRYSGWITRPIYSYTFSSAGAFRINIKIKDANGTISKDIMSDYIAVDTEVPPMIASVTANVAEVDVGDDVVWTPNVTSDGAGALKYYYIVHKDGKPIRYTGWINASTYKYTFTSAGTFSVKVKIKDKDDAISETVMSPDTDVAAVALPEVASVAASVKNAVVEGSIKWTPNVTSEGAGALKYYYIVYKDDKPIRYTGWIAASAYNYTFTADGTFSVKVKIKDAKDVVSETVESPDTIVAKKALPTISSVATSVTATNIGDTVTWTTNVANDGEGSLKYYYIVRKDDKPIRYTGWITASTYYYTFTSAGKYSVAVRIKDADGVISETVSSPNTAVGIDMATPVISSVAANITSADIDDVVTWTPSISSSGAGSLTYYYTVYKNGSPVKSSGWVSQTVYQYTFASAGTYYIAVKVKDADEAISATVSSANIVVASASAPSTTTYINYSGTVSTSTSLKSTQSISLSGTPVVSAVTKGSIKVILYCSTSAYSKTYTLNASIGGYTGSTTFKFNKDNCTGASITLNIKVPETFNVNGITQMSVWDSSANSDKVFIKKTQNVRAYYELPNP